MGKDMKQFFKILAVTGSLLLSSAALAAETCTVCPQIDDLLKRMDKVAPDPMNDQTLAQQDHLSGEALEIVRTALSAKNFTAANSKAVVKLIAKTIPYDNSLDFERANMPAFKKLYNKKDSLLKSTINEMQKSGEISSKDKSDILELFGIVPSHDAAPVEK
jgi:hypothetical protein